MNEQKRTLSASEKLYNLIEAMIEMDIDEYGSLGETLKAHGIDPDEVFERFKIKLKELIVEETIQ